MTTNTREYMKEYRKRPGVREKGLKSQQKYNQKNKEKIKAYFQKSEIKARTKKYNQEYYQKNKENIKVRNLVNAKRYAKIHPEIIKAHTLAQKIPQDDLSGIFYAKI